MAVTAHTDEKLHDEGTPASWVAVSLAFTGFVVGGVGFPLASLPIIILGGVLILIAPLFGKILQVMGFGHQLTRPTVAPEAPKAEALAEPAEQTA